MPERERVPSPDVVPPGEWLSRRLTLLRAEKELTAQLDRVNAARRRLPMVKLDKGYTFDGPNGKATLLDLFAGRRQLIVYHFMFDPAWEKGCPGCTGLCRRARRPFDARPAQHQLRARLARPAGEARRLTGSSRAGSGPGFPRSAATSTTTST